MRAWAIAASIFAAVTLSGCDSMKIEDFEGKEPKLVLEEYFQGQTRAWGIFEDRFGNLKREFTVDIAGTWDGETLVLDEDFVYADGETDKRVWTLTKTGPDTYEGTADDVDGVARGQTAGNAFTWSYNIDLPVGDTTYNVHFEDWMFLQDDGVLINRAYVTKWGFRVGSATIVFRKVDEAAENAGTGAQRSAAE